MKSTLKVSDIGEKGLIERIIQKSKSCSVNDSINTSFNDFKTSIGDDSALINQNLNKNSYLVASSDMLIQSIHFPKGMTYYQMGYKSVVVNVSDLASMGAENIGFLLNIAVPKDMPLDDFDDLICGVVQACNKYSIPLVGGDTNEANEIIISGTAIGEVKKDNALMKYGFNPGDLVCISGELGLAALGFEVLKIKENKNQEKLDLINSIDSSLVDLAIFKALKPEAKYEEGRILSKYNSEKNRISATDITDGIASEFYELLNSDKQFSLYNGHEDNNYSKGICIYEDKLPIEDEFKEIAKVLNLDYLGLFLHIGEDFELLFTINKELKDHLSKEMNFYIIGEISDKDTVEMVLSNGDIKEISSKGYQHLK